MSGRRGPSYSHVVGFDDAPFEPAERGEVLIVGAVYSRACLEGVMSGHVRRDGDDATRVLARLVARSRFAAHLQAVLIQGIAMGGFNVVDIHALRRAVHRPVITAVRHAPDLEAIHRALLQNVPGGARKWERIERAGPMQYLAGLYVQLAGIAPEAAEPLLERLRIHGRLPEPLRTAHLIAGGIATGESRHRA